MALTSAQRLAEANIYDDETPGFGLQKFARGLRKLAQGAKQDKRPVLSDIRIWIYRAGCGYRSLSLSG